MTEIHTAVEAKPDTIYMIPSDIIQLISEAEAGLLPWDFVIDEATKAAKEGRIGIITNIG